MISHEAAELARVADTFAWVEVAASPSQPNHLTLLSREDFLHKAVGNGNGHPLHHIPPQPSGAS